MKRAKGFTLIEVIAAIAIIAIGLVSLLALFPTGIGLNQQSAGTTSAILLCKEMMEQIKTAASSKTGATSSEYVTFDDLANTTGNEWYKFKKYEEPAVAQERQVFPQNDLYEVSIQFDDNITGLPNDSNFEFMLVKVIVTAHWPRATGSGAAIQAAKETQSSTKLISYIKCRQKVLVGP
jgi:prepilin-type N-terminal cleavage/methylation domain-containing protein